ncbi:MAG: DUF1049 domain-containing protein [Hyphomicrobiales bacterium]|nr:DUF1049 domain-containing protein [Rickettsiales bacterium]MCP5361997.1 DUF1049 domain-containing protein [Hyphomicrobiales bacterium]
MRFLRFTFLIIFGLFLLSFALSNREQVTLSIFPLPYEVDLPLFVPLLFTLACGLLLGWLWLVGVRISAAHQRHKLEKEIKHLKESLDDARQAMQAQAIEGQEGASS